MTSTVGKKKHDTAMILHASLGNTAKDIAEVYADGLQVVGAGLGRTGTSSLQLALEILYGAPCYHMREVIGKSHASFFTALKQGKVTSEQIRGHFKSYACTQDIPTSLFWEELLAANPDAKVVLTVRDFDGWWKSMNQTILLTAPGNPNIWWGMFLIQHIVPMWIEWADMMWDVFYGPPHFRGDFSKESGKRVFEEWNASVIRKCPKEKLLVFEVKQGWAPLCEFLGKPIPDQPFPNVNDTANMRKMYMIKNTVGYLSIIMIPLILVAAIIKRMVKAFKSCCGIRDPYTEISD